MRWERKGRTALLAVRGLFVGAHSYNHRLPCPACPERHFRPSSLSLPSRALHCNEFNAGKNNTGAGQVPRAARPLCPRWNRGRLLATVPFRVFPQVLQDRKTNTSLLKAECHVTRAHTCQRRPMTPLRAVYSTLCKLHFTRETKINSKVKQRKSMINRDLAYWPFSTSSSESHRPFYALFPWFHFY